MGTGLEARSADIAGVDEVHRFALACGREELPVALRRAFVQENLCWLCRECHLQKTRFDRLLARYLRDCGLDWHGALRAVAANRRWVTTFLQPFGIEFDSQNTARSGFKSAA